MHHFIFNIIIALIFTNIHILTAADKKDDERYLAREYLPSWDNIQDDVIYKQDDKINLAMTIFNSQLNNRKKPLVVYIHGGGWTGGNRYNVLRRVDLSVVYELNKQGVVCVSIDYRLVKNNEVTAFDSVIDCFDAIRHLVLNADKYGIDPERIGLFGGSAGGHLALVTALGIPSDYCIDVPPVDIGWKIRCVAAYYPRVSFSDPVMLKSDKVPWESVQRGVHSALGGPLDQKFEIAHKLSPIELLQINSPPIFLAHGDADDILPVCNSTAMRDVAQAKGVPVECIIVKGAKHCFDGQNNIPTDDDIVKRTVDFLLTNLR